MTIHPNQRSTKRHAPRRISLLQQVSTRVTWLTTWSLRKFSSRRVPRELFNLTGTHRSRELQAAIKAYDLAVSNLQCQIKLAYAEFKEEELKRKELNKTKNND